MPVWGYTKTTGPHTWAVHFPAACGTKQSPIDIDSGRGEELTDVAPLSYHYREDACGAITNTGVGWKLLTGGDNPGEVEGGPLPSRYRLEQIHMHWGGTEQEGSEHTVDGKAYPGEVHLVHWDCENYATFDEAVSKPGGLTVLGVFLELGEENSELKKVIEALQKIPHKDMTSPMSTAVNPLGLLPGGAYWNYDGSLTTPPCLETVNWVVFKTPKTISQEQLNELRKMRTYAPDESEPKDEFKGQVIQNFRPPMPLCGRGVKECC
ncbi:unnamed protein product [Cyprideis torosa]|uniref:Carbonic anhydrase n=1 Tax=Cyprideis torosa TaxID=163714 RepID=A0A7R8WFG7_9CRUS|nr:unnamed protein product [Cyprideis torosa]CAG0896944.1 unnamed protein product [Cyprideis torosa]